MPTPDEPTRLVVDTSVFARLGLSGNVTEAFARLVERLNASQILLCPPVAAEVGYMARDPKQHSEFVRDLSEYSACHASPSTNDVLEIQHALWTHGLVRAAGATDTIIAAYAKVNDAAVLHYDSDFEHIAAADPAFRHHWIVPRGTAD